ncbi:hypothetical protein EJ04DRAFT_493173 [Polyplosphaeria fusca]|uniref:CUE domain-containing protein n=1 Tax=Polyplosphaeria fusca TaxID=682080 RepID=A0A9P4V301_9PLEO|nr:hypothetical protein EJ04DRAFT_493173 [Polyplosphaeria fusca]
MALPSLAPFPDEAVRASIPPAEWALCLDSWASLSDLYLRLKDHEFSSTLANENSLGEYLVSYFKALALDDFLASNTSNLRKPSFLLLHRIFSGDEVPPPLLQWSALADICHAFPKSEQLRLLLQGLWKHKRSAVEESVQAAKATLIRLLDSRSPNQAEGDLTRLAPLLRLSPDAARLMLTGSDFLDTMNSAYDKLSPPFQRKTVTVAFVGLVSLLEDTKPQYSVLSDHLYSLRSSTERQQKPGSAKASFLSDLVTNTPLLTKISNEVSAPEGSRAKHIAASLGKFRQAGIARPKKLVRRKVDRGKAKARDGTPVEVHVHRMSLVSQIQDLFPDLGSGFVVKLLDAYNDNVEEVTAHLLERSLPPTLANADRHEQLPMAVASTQPRLTPRSTPPPSERRNVYDNDEFDKLTVDTSRLHIGRKNEKFTADNLLSDRSSAPNKSAILAALAAFDSDDDERDDTYDVEDVGGTVDSAVPSTDDLDAHEEDLFRVYSTSPGVFGRDAVTRRGKERAALRASTGMADEAIEGWAVMLQRDPRKLRRLEARYSTFSGQQAELASTAYRNSAADSGAEGGEGSGDGQRGGRGGWAGQGQSRGRGRGGGRGGGNAAGPSEDKSTQASRQRKEANKGSRANHNRRDQRARKMARGGMLG